MVSEICSDTVSTGLSDDIGSWKIIAISPPRMPRSERFDDFSRSCPLNTIEPLGMRVVARSCSRRMESAVTLLPLPDSPTTPTQSPSPMSIDTPSTAVTQPASTRNCTVRSRIASSGAAATLVASLHDDVAPACQRRLHADAEKAQRRLGKDGVGEDEGQVDKQRTETVRQNMTHDDPQG